MMRFTVDEKERQYVEHDESMATGRYYRCDGGRPRRGAGTRR